jgi:para-nitrobenzyl esterase
MNYLKLTVFTLALLSSACAVGNGFEFGSTVSRIVTASGEIIGVSDGEYWMFRGIPYAKPPVGDLRWRPPQDALPWQQALDVTRPGPHCPQTRYLETSSEDCLTLNVYAPAPKPKGTLPVLVWIHGGGFRSGTGAYYSSSSVGDVAEEVRGTLWNRQGIIVVTLNYRLGALGYFAHEALDGSEGVNFGLLDIVAALRWVNRNIDSFGGDKNRVTIMGGSAGAMAVQTLMVMPQAHGLFSAAISQSGYGTTLLPRTKGVTELSGSPSAEEAARGIAERAMESPVDQVRPEDLRALTADQLVNAINGYHYPIVDGITLLEEPGVLFRQGKQHPVPYMSGGNTFDGSGYDDDVGLPPDELLEKTQPHTEAVKTLYGIEEVAAYPTEVKQLFGDMRYVSAARYTTQQMHRVDQPAYLYLFDYVPPAERDTLPGATHSWQKRPLFRDTSPPVINAMRQYIVNFTKTGDPNGNGVPEWPAVHADKMAWMVFGDEAQVEYRVWQEKLDLLQSIYKHRVSALIQP